MTLLRDFIHNEADIDGLSVALGAIVYATSGSENKIDKAIKLGAKGGVNYREGCLVYANTYRVVDDCRQMTGRKNLRSC